MKEERCIMTQNASQVKRIQLLREVFNLSGGGTGKRDCQWYAIAARNPSRPISGITYTRPEGIYPLYWAKFRFSLSLRWPCNDRTPDRWPDREADSRHNNQMRSGTFRRCRHPTWLSCRTSSGPSPYPARTGPRDPGSYRR